MFHCLFMMQAGPKQQLLLKRDVVAFTSGDKFILSGEDQGHGEVWQALTEMLRKAWRRHGESCG